MNYQPQFNYANYTGGTGLSTPTLTKIADLSITDLGHFEPGTTIFVGPGFNPGRGDNGSIVGYGTPVFQGMSTQINNNINYIPNAPNFYKKLPPNNNYTPQQKKQNLNKINISENKNNSFKIKKNIMPLKFNNFIDNSFSMNKNNNSINNNNINNFNLTKNNNNIINSKNINNLSLNKNKSNINTNNNVNNKININKNNNIINNKININKNNNIININNNNKINKIYINNNINANNNINNNKNLINFKLNNNNYNNMNKNNNFIINKNHDINNNKMNNLFIDLSNKKEKLKNQNHFATDANNFETKFQCKKIFGNLKYKKEIKNNLFERKNNFNKNIIYYDEEITTEENNNICTYFKLNLRGTFYGVNNFELFKYICTLIDIKKRPFILVCSGSSAEKAFKYCSNKKMICEFYIYCLHREKYIYLEKKYIILKGIYDNFDNLIKDLFYNDNSLIINLPVLSSNVIFLKEYNNLYIKFHCEIIRKYSLYKLFKSKKWDQSKFLEIIEKKKPYYSDLARQLLYHDDEAMIKFFKEKTNENEQTLRNVFNKKHNIQNYISNYTLESFYYKYINLFLRKGDYNSYRLLSNHISKFIYHLYEFRKHQNQAMHATLYRKMYISKEELKVYINSLGKVICYPSFTSTSLFPNRFEPHNPNDGSILVQLVIEQNNSKSIICIKELSKLPKEEEYLCLPFSFFKITMILGKDKNNPYAIYLTALNSEKPLEEMLLEFMEYETDNLDFEGLDMICTTNSDTTMVLNKCLNYNFYMTHVFGPKKV